jgi:transposase
VPNDSRASPFFADPDASTRPAAVCGSRPSHRARPSFAEPPWNCQSPEWLAIDRSLDEDHLARRIARLVDEELDLGLIVSSYAGRGSLPNRPELLLKMMLYEHQVGRPQPSQWLSDLKENKAIEWLTFGIKVSRSTLYEFRDRVQPFLAGLNQQVIRTAIGEKQTDASAASLDGTFVAANASRHRLLSLEVVEQRLEQLDREIAEIETAEVAKQRVQVAAITGENSVVETGVDEAILARSETELNPQSSATENPSAQPRAANDRPCSFLGKTKRGLNRQRAQYRKAQGILQERNRINARRRKDKRKKSERVRVAIGDPTAPFGRDKMKVYRPLYNVQTMTGVETDFVFAYSVTPTLSDSGHLVPMIDRMTVATGQPLKKVLADSGYPSGDELAECEARRVNVIAPWNENSFTAEKRTKDGKDAPIRKNEFSWDPTIPGYRCPQGHLLTYRERTTKQKANGDSVPLEIYQADAADCRECPLKARCVQSSSGARTVRRQPHEDLIDKMRDRMKTPEGKALYGQRGCTVERRFADMKWFRGLQRISGRTPERAEAQVGLTILIHNLITLDNRRIREAVGENPLKTAL